MHARERTTFTFLFCTVLALPVLSLQAQDGASEKEAERQMHPCAHEPAYRQFDFWVGTWEVFTPQGHKAGTNRIDKTLDGCLLIENWTGTSGVSGKSMNYYDAAAKKWVQIWINSRGGITRYEGAYSDGAMRFEGEKIAEDGTRLHYRMRFTPLPDGSVRQYIEESRDQGGHWQEWFDGKYVKSEPAQ